MASIGQQLSDYFRSDVFHKVYLTMVKESTKESNAGDFRRGEGMYGIIKNDCYSIWGALRGHRLVIEYDVPLDAQFLDNSIEEMMSWMFPGCRDLKAPSIVTVGHKGFTDNKAKVPS